MTSTRFFTSGSIIIMVATQKEILSVPRTKKMRFEQLIRKVGGSASNKVDNVRGSPHKLGSAQSEAEELHDVDLPIEYSIK